MSPYKISDNRKCIALLVRIISLYNLFPSVCIYEFYLASHSLSFPKDLAQSPTTHVLAEFLGFQGYLLTLFKSRFQDRPEIFYRVKIRRVFWPLFFTPKRIEVLTTPFLCPNGSVSRCTVLHEDNFRHVLHKFLLLGINLTCLMPVNCILRHWVTHSSNPVCQRACRLPSFS